MGGVGMNLNSLKKETLAEARQFSVSVDSRTTLVPIGSWIFAGKPSFFSKMRDWRELNHSAFFYEAKPSEEKFRSHLESTVIGDGSRVLFGIFFDGELVGHLGLSDVSEEEANLDNVMRSPEKLWPGEFDLMKESIQSLANWASSFLGIKTIQLLVRSDNARAISLYRRCEFEQITETCLRAVYTGTHQTYVESTAEDSNTSIKKLVFARQVVP